MSGKLKFKTNGEAESLVANIAAVPMTYKLLKETSIGRLVNDLRRAWKSQHKTVYMYVCVYVCVYMCRIYIYIYIYIYK